MTITPYIARIVGLIAEGHDNEEISARVRKSVTAVNRVLNRCYEHYRLQDWGNPRVRLVLEWQKNKAGDEKYE